jgi:hypothetical protein
MEATTRFEDVAAGRDASLGPESNEPTEAVMHLEVVLTRWP